jgi:NTP pyrophosphatase (non-canonical NTP hydrolase)
VGDEDATISELKETVKRYCEERDWDQYHNPKDLAIAVITEAAEMLEPLRFKTDRQMIEMMKDPVAKGEIGEEMADTLYFLLRFAQKYDIDLADAFEKKMEKNRKKYPVEKSKGSNKKYDEF